MKAYKGLWLAAGILLLTACQKEQPSVEELHTQNSTVAAGTISGTDEVIPEYAETSTKEFTSSSAAEEESEANEAAPFIPSPKDVNYCYHNGLLQESVNWGDNVDYPEIDGLKNEKVQQRINDRIKEAVEELYSRELPPYRGIRVLVPDEEISGLHSNIYSTTYYNESNIYSVLIRKYLRDSEYTIYIEDVIALNFDLQTGEEITLSDLFAAEYDYRSVISEYVRECIAQNMLDDLLDNDASIYSSSFALIRPFETIEEEQKFIISSWDEVYLILDYNNREFDVGTEVRFLPVKSHLLPDQGRELIFTEKYENWNESLYKDGFNRWKSLKEDSDYQSEMWISDSSPLEDMQFRTKISCNIENTQLSQHYAGVVGQLEDRVIAILAENGKTAEEFYGGDYSLTVNNYGKFITEYEGYSFWGPDAYIYDNHFSVYDGATGKVVALEECFVPEVNYRELIISQEMARDESLSREELVRGLRDPEFMIYPTYFTILYTRMDNDYGVYKSNIYVEFEDLGEENLTIFE